MKSKLSSRIAKFSPCLDAMEWLDNQKSATVAWKSCKRGDWMLWLLGRMIGESKSNARQKLVGCAAECAELALPIFEKRYPDDNRVRECIKVCKRWSTGKATIEELTEARRLAAAAADGADADAAAAAAAVAAAVAISAAISAIADAVAISAAISAIADAVAAAAAYDAAYDAAAVADAAAAVAAVAAVARTKVLAQCSDIVRKWYPKVPKIT